MGTIHRNVGTGTHGNTNIGARQGRRIVDAVAGHSDTMPSRLEVGGQALLILWLDLAMHFFDTQLAGHRTRRGRTVASGHNDPDASILKVLHGLPGGRLDWVSYRQQAGQGTVYRQVHDACAFSTQLFGTCLQGLAGHARIGQQGSVAQQQAPPIDPASHSNPRGALELIRFAQRQPLHPGLIDNGMRQWMLTALVKAGGQPQNLFSTKAGCCFDALEYRAPFSEGAGFIDDQRINLAQVLDGRRIAEQYPTASSLARSDHYRHRGRQAEGAGAGDDQHRHSVDQTKHPTGLWPPDSPTNQGQGRDGDDDHHEVAGNDVSQALHRRLRALRLHNHLHDLRKHGFRSDLLRLHHQAAVGVQGCPDERVAHLLQHRQRFASQHGFIDGAFALYDQAIDRDLLSGADAQPIARVHMALRDVLFAAIGIDPPGCLRC